MYNKKELKYSIRKLKVGVGAVLIGAVLLNGTSVNAQEAVPAQPDNAAANPNASQDDKAKIETYKAMYKKIKELVDAGNSYYATAWNEPAGEKLKAVSEGSKKDTATVQEWEDALVEYGSYGVVKKQNSDQYYQFKTVDEFSPHVEKNYTEAVTKTKEEETKKIDSSSVSQELKDKYKAMLNKETNLTNVRKNIPEQFNKALAQEQKQKLQQEIEVAKQQINQMGYLKAKNKYIELLDKAASSEEIKNHLDMAKQEAEQDKKNHEAVAKVQEAINKLKHLTSDEKSQYNLLLDTATPEQAQKYLDEAKQKNKTNLLNKILTLVNEVKNDLAELAKLPELPNTDDYAIQKELWETTTTGNPLKKYISDLVSLSTEVKLKTLDEKALEDRYTKLIESKYYIQIESITRQVAQIRTQYPNSQSISGVYNNGMKQTRDNHYGTLPAKDLKSHIDNDLIPGLQKIKLIVSNLEKKAAAKAEIDALINGLEKNQHATELLASLEQVKGTIDSIIDSATNISSIITPHINEAKQRVEQYKRDYKDYNDTVKKAHEDVKALLEQLKATNIAKANTVAQALQDIEKTIDQTTLANYKVLVPGIVKNIREQVEEFLAKHKPLTPLMPSVTKTTETVTEDIDYTTQEVPNPNLPKGQRVVRTQGQKGKRTITYEVRKQGQTELSRTKVSEVETQSPVTEVVEVGTKEALKPVQPMKPIQPTPTPMPKPAPPRRSDKHKEKMAPKKEMDMSSKQGMMPAPMPNTNKQMMPKDNKAPKKTLPKTGDNSAIFSMVGVAMTMLSALGIKKRHKDNN